MRAHDARRCGAHLGLYRRLQHQLCAQVPEGQHCRHCCPGQLVVLGPHIVSHILCRSQESRKGLPFSSATILPFDITFLLIFYIHHDQDEEEWEWKRRDELIHPNDRRRIIHLRVPRRNVVASTMHGGGGAAPTHPMHQDVYGTREIHCNPSQSAI